MRLICDKQWHTETMNSDHMKKAGPAQTEALHSTSSSSNPSLWMGCMALDI